MKYLLGTILLLAINYSIAEEYEISGYAPGFVGKKVELFTYQDYITMTRVKLGEGVVSEEDSIFHVSVEAGTTIQCILQIGKTEAPLYVAPNTSYHVYYPVVIGQPITFTNQRTNVYFQDLDTTDINYRILQYNQWFDSFIAYHEVDIAKGQFLTYLDTFKLYAAEAYKDVKDEYFITYVRYNIGEMQQTFGGNSKSSKRLETFLNYIEPFPVYYENDQYMDFIRGFYSKGFEGYLPKVEAEINMAIYNASPTRLMSALKQDLFLSNSEIREMVMIDQLGKSFYKRGDQKRNILVMLDSISKHAYYRVNATIAKNVKLYLVSLEPGFPAPSINLPNMRDTLSPLTWTDFEGKFVYFNFFATWNDQAKVDMKIIADLKVKYGQYVSFLSVCTDESKSDFSKFIVDNPEYDWDIVYIGNEHELNEDFHVKVVPSYFLIDQSGFIAVAPAPSPSPDGEYESIDKTFFFIKKALSRDSEGRIGEP